MKNTSAFRFFAPLVTQQPPFGRADLATQIEYAAALNPCAVVIDRSYLYEEELRDLGISKIGVISKCIRKLDGEKFQEESRYFLLDFREQRCTPRVSTAVRRSVDLVSSGDFQWQNITGGIEEYYKEFPLVAITQQNVIMYALRGGSESENLSLSLMLYSQGQPVSDNSFQFCIYIPKAKCEQARTDAKGLASVQITLRESSYFHSIINISVNNAGELVDQWGVSLSELSSEE
jgi:hypothetical protein